MSGATASGSNPVGAASRAVTFGQVTEVIDAAGKVSQGTLEQQIRTLLRTSDRIEQAGAELSELRVTAQRADGVALPNG